MKKNWMKKLSAALCAATLFASLSATAVFAVEETPGADDKNPDKFEIVDYQDLMGVLGRENAPENGSLTVEKKISNVYAEDGTPTEEFEEGAIAVEGVQFTVTEVGHYATYVDGNNVAQVRIGIDVALANLIGIPTTGENVVTGTESTTSYVYLTSEAFNKINKNIVTALKNTDASTGKSTTIEEFNATFANYSSRQVTTEANGKGKIDQLPFGIYLVRETSVANAKTVNGPVYFSEKQYPYVVSVPAWTEKNGAENWYVDIDARAKNATETVNIDKFIKRDTDSVSKTDKGEHKNDVTHVGDYVEFTLDADVPILEDPINRNDAIDSYEINDNLSKGLTLNATWIDEAESTETGNIYVVDGNSKGTDGNGLGVVGEGVEYKLGIDYVVTNYTNDATTGTLYEGGFTFTIEFTKTGLAKLTAYARNDEDLDTGKYIKVNYSVRVNENAVVGEDGNPNKTQLQFSAAGSPEISTIWHDVTEFIFTMDAKKTFDGKDATSEQADDVTFELYLDKGETRPVILNKVSDNTADKGKYTYGGEGTTNTAPTQIALSDTGTFSIKGVPVTEENSGKEVILYLKETSTVDG